MRLPESSLPPGFVYLRDVDPTIAQDIRYAGSNNFVGHPLPGYVAPECILRRDVALALKQVQADLAAAGRGLKVYDCYRPTQAVRAMVRWAYDRTAGRADQAILIRGCRRVRCSRSAISRRCRGTRPGPQST